MSNHYIFDPHIGHRGRPRFVTNIDGVEYRYNSTGFRDVERSSKKPNHTLRIALIGDSFVEGYECEASNTIGPTLQRLINEDLFIASQLNGSQINNIEVLSFGQAGFNPMLYWRLLKYYVLNYSPDMIFVNIFSFNDLAGLIPFKIRREKGGYWTPPLDYYDIDGDSLKLRKASLYKYRYMLFFSRLKQALSGHWNNIIRNQSRRFWETKPSKSMLGVRKNNHSDWTKGYSPILAKGLFAYSVLEKETLRSYSICEKFIDLMRTDAIMNNAKLVIVHLANADILSPELFVREKLYWSEFYRTQTLKEYDYGNLSVDLPTQEFGRICRKLELSFLDLNHYILQQFPEINWKDIFYHNDRPNSWDTWGHYTQHGNLIWAKLLLSHIIEKLPNLINSYTPASESYNPYAYPLT